MTEFLPLNERENNSSSMEINPRGARIESLILGGHQLLSKVSRGDGKEASTHPCTPIFGPDGQKRFGLSQHGDARKDDWAVITSQPNLVELAYEISDGTYPPGMKVRQRFELKDGLFQLVTTHENDNVSVAMPVNLAEHFYWLAPQGWHGVKVNGIDVSNVVLEDRAIPWEDDNIIEISGQPRIRLQQQGLPYMQGWVGGKEDDEGNKISTDMRYVCLEACEGPGERFGSDASMIGPKSSRTTEVVIRLAA
ncbi:MAG: hypothetical protein ACR2LN_05290 [Candidatus Levyibacteriota bacterium]